ncbi:DUF4129 domain-containing protein [Candidatus Acetothermia bacterium]|jgi:hypothetical protein|nr:DUF4129 domain-containing protein [Candidatus Acetothermia bacterium]MCI2425865.1 DUF4129 domain-containing protein [Candidatus Acetothermia bacterium]MCI2427756.1 DUF4129 domain-containing protein [Candidatus Acetothermia bacterium]MCI2428468.1 DUF4129 domain-containing protein [Candidatus Acetothermia bacterium]
MKSIKNDRQRIKLAIFVLAGGAVVSLVLLSAVLDGLKFAPGIPLPPPEAPAIDAPLQLADELPWDQIMRWIWLLFLGLAGLGLILELLTAHGRRRIFFYAVWVGLFAGIIFGGITLLERFLPDALPVAHEQQVLHAPLDDRRVDDAAITEEFVVPVVEEIPLWAIFLVTTAVATIGLFLLFRLYRAWKNRWRRLATLQDLALQAQIAAEQIEYGADLRDIVIRCYNEMKLIVSRATGVKDSAAITPREFASLLYAAGIKDEHIVKLTALFEEVRYGGKESSVRRADALACLDALASAYSR